MADRTKAGETGADQASASEESPAAALDNAANGGATPISAARRTKAEKAEKAEKNEKGELAANGEADDKASPEAGTQGAEQEEAKPVRTAADIVAENAAKKAEEEAAAKQSAAGATGAAGGTATKTATKPAAKPAAKTAAATTATAKKTAVAAKPANKPVEPASKGRAALDAAGKGLTQARNLLASIVWLVAVLCAAVLALGALFTALKQTNETNEIVKWVLARGHDLVGPFDDLFKLKTAKNTLLVNWGIAALAYLVVGKIAERIIRP